VRLTSELQRKKFIPSRMEKSESNDQRHSNQSAKLKQAVNRARHLKQGSSELISKFRASISIPQRRRNLKFSSAEPYNEPTNLQLQTFGHEHPPTDRQGDRRPAFKRESCSSDKWRRTVGSVGVTGELSVDLHDSLSFQQAKTHTLWNNLQDSKFLARSVDDSHRLRVLRDP
jgi:hypothetical protein